MAGDENCYLRLNQSESNIRTIWQQLQEENDFCDVTLACNDRQIQSHKIIVSHSSPILKNIFKQTLGQNPVIYLCGVNYKNLDNLVCFMYHGEVTVAEEDLQNLLDIAEDLKITGLCEENREILPTSEGLPSLIDEVLPFNSSEELHTNPDKELVQQNAMESSPKRKHKIQKVTKLKSNNCDPIEITDSLNSENEIFEKCNLQNLKSETNGEVSNLGNETHNTQKLVSIIDRQVNCNMCNKQYTRESNLRLHKASAHEGIRYPCDQCSASPFSSAHSLRRHKASAHEGVRYPCDQCNIAPFIQEDSLKRHKASVHEGVMYSCVQCDAAPFATPSLLKHHKASVHEGVIFPCNQCNIKPFTYASMLKQHKASVHVGVRYPCDQCDIKPFTSRSYIRIHKATAHEGVIYPCDQCDIKPFTHRSYLRNHNATAHKGVRYPCNQCNIKPFTDKSTLKKHKAAIHEGVRYECSRCDYKATRKGNLKMHIKNIHKS